MQRHAFQFTGNSLTLYSIDLAWCPYPSFNLPLITLLCETQALHQYKLKYRWCYGGKIISLPSLIVSGFLEWFKIQKLILLRDLRDAYLVQSWYFGVRIFLYYRKRWFLCYLTCPSRTTYRLSLWPNLENLDNNLMVVISRNTYLLVIGAGSSSGIYQDGWHGSKFAQRMDAII